MPPSNPAWLRCSRDSLPVGSFVRCAERSACGDFVTRSTTGSVPIGQPDRSSREEGSIRTLLAYGAAADLRSGRGDRPGLCPFLTPQGAFLVTTVAAYRTVGARCWLPGRKPGGRYSTSTPKIAAG